MGRLVKDARLSTREARGRLKEQKEPHWRLINEGTHLGYYKGKNGGVWYARARVNKKYHWIKLAKADDFVDANGETVLDYAQAQNEAIQYANSLTITTDYKALKNYTVNDAIKDYLEDFKASGKKSLYATTAQINAHIAPILGDTPLVKLTHNRLNNWRNKLATSPKRIRSSKKATKKQNYLENDLNDPEYQRKRRATTNRILTILKAILNHAYENKKIGSNESWKTVKPFKDVSTPKVRFLNEAEAIRLLNACEPHFRNLVRGALLTGARYGELAKLNVNDYNPDNNTLSIHESKSGKPRHIPLNQEGIHFFEQLIVGKKSNDLIFTRTDGAQWKRSYQTRPLEAACKAANITPAINFHILRHTYASSLAMRGAPLQVIATVLGHADTRITHKHYAHLMPSYVADVIKQNLPGFGRTESTNVESLTLKAV